MPRWAPPVAAAAMLAIGAWGIAAGGRLLGVEASPTVDIPALPEPDDTAGDTQPAAAPARPTASSRVIAPKMVAPPEVDAEGLVWSAPREPLSTLSQALPPKPEPADRRLFQPVVVGSSAVESKGRTVTMAGTVSIAPEESCDFEGRSWACGVRARTAFRMWLRGRALECDLAPDAPVEVTATCMLGTQDAGQWLVANGWARAAAGGPYVEIGDAARRAGKGVYGAPPDTSDLPPPPADFTASTPPADFTASTPPVDPPAPSE